jgi:concanavalin A-like lectin/glucanase superfamily protein
VVLIGRSAVLGLVVLAGCSESLFGAHRAGRGDDDDAGSGSDNVPGACAAPCVGDAAADFDGTATGKGGRWRYLEDHRNRTWAAMTASATEMTGKNTANQITTCAAHPDAEACKALPGALLVSSAGGASDADPAIELTAPADQVIQLSLHAYVPSGVDQTIRLYRNSREDVLFTGTATAGQPLRQAITLDALTGDRFLVAVTPTAPLGSGAARVGLDLFAAGTKAAFPASCQLALPFDSASGNTTDDRCRHVVFTDYDYSPTPSPGTSTARPAVLDMGPFPELHRAIVIRSNEYLGPMLANRLDWSGDMTVQLWVQLSLRPSSEAWLFHDLDPDVGGGVGISFRPLGAGNELGLTACTDATPNAVTLGTTGVPYPTDGNWRFVRIVRAGDTMHVCLDGEYMTSLSLASNLSTLGTSYVPTLGKQDSMSPPGAYFNGLLDDVRAITGALPCAPPP